jgi:D-alanyl-lipoteichoic acid acyltransferase DltB (MBOAT superfamily)
MSFASCSFILAFLPLALAGFALAVRLSPVAAKLWLIAASLMFYGWWNPAFVPVLLASAAGNAGVSRLLHRPGLAARQRRAVLIAALIANLGALCWFRYLAEWLAGLDAWFGTGVTMAAPLVPLGISFFTFTQIGYLLDCHASTEAPRPLLDYALFVLFFPSLIAGPILTGRVMLPQIETLGRGLPRGQDLAAGSAIFVIGLLKKVVLADPLADTVAQGFAHPETLTLLPAWQVAASYSLQLYFDFSGYSDMAVGTARLFGLSLPWNFASPYRAGSIIAYWQRWHISLTRFFMAALHAPLTMAAIRRRRARGLPTDRAAQRGGRGFLTMLAGPIVVTMVLAGVWHGAGLTFLVFGLLHATYLVINHAWRLYRPAPPAPRGLRLVAGIGLTYLCVLIAAVFFRAPTVPAAWQVLTGMAGGHGVGPVPDAQAVPALGVLVLLYVVVWAMPNTQQIVAEGERAAWSWRPCLGWAMATGCAATIGLLSLGGGAEFLYFQF